MQEKQCLYIKNMLTVYIMDQGWSQTFGIGCGKWYRICRYRKYQSWMMGVRVGVVLWGTINIGRNTRSQVSSYVNDTCSHNSYEGTTCRYLVNDIQSWPKHHTLIKRSRDKETFCNSFVNNHPQERTVHLPIHRGSEPTLQHLSLCTSMTIPLDDGMYDEVLVVKLEWQYPHRKRREQLHAPL